MSSVLYGDSQYLLHEPLKSDKDIGKSSEQEYSDLQSIPHHLFYPLLGLRIQSNFTVATKEVYIAENLEY